MPVSPRVETATPGVHSGSANSRLPPLRSPSVLRQPQKPRDQAGHPDSGYSLYSQMPQRQQRQGYIQHSVPNQQLHHQQLLQTAPGTESRLSGLGSRENKNPSIGRGEDNTSNSSYRVPGTNQPAKGFVPGGELTLRVTTLSPYAYSIYTNAVDSGSSSNSGNILEGAIQRSLRNMYNHSNSNNSYLINSRNFSYFGLAATGTPAFTAPTATSALRPRKTSSRLRFMQHQQQQQHQHQQQQQQQQQQQKQGKIKSKGKKSQPVSLRPQIAIDDLSPEVVTHYLRQNPDVLDKIVASDLVHADRLKEWVHRKSKQNHDQEQSPGQNDLRERSDNSVLSRAGCGTDRHKHSAHAQFAMENGDHSSFSSLVLHQWKTKLQMSKKKVLHELSREFHHISGKVRVLLELADCVAAAVSADSFTLYSCDVARQELTHLRKNEQGEVEHGTKESIGSRTSVAAVAAHTKETVRLKDLSNQHSADGLSVSSTRAHNVMALPVLDDQNTCFGVVELHRHSEHSHFSDEEEEVVLIMLQWYDMLLDYVEISCLILAIGASALVKAETHSTMMRQQTLSDFLLEVTKSIFQDIVSMDVVIMKIMNFAKALVHADRTALFLLDTRSNELYARIFDDGYSLEEFSSPMEAKVRAMDASDSDGSGGRPERKKKSESDGAGLDSPSHMQTDNGGEERRDTEKKKRAEWYSDDIRFSMEKGVAGYVASTGKILNIVDAYKDKRFNPEVDIRTGYKTKTILCMPIFIRGNVIGVVQMVNKLQGTFTNKDEESFATFAIYCGLALHHAKLYEKIRRSEQKYKVALDVLSYHSQALPEEVQTLRARPLPDHIPDITAYHFSPWSVMEDDKPLQCLFMFRSLFENIKYDMDDLVRFTLTVRKNYRNVPYHNWTHAFSVAHSMFVVIKTTKHRLSPVESISLFVACLCHDLDHRGKTNQFMVQSASPLAAIYSTSTMEHHHFNQTVTILQNEGHNIFKYLSSDDYKQVLSDIKQSILATDLAVFFKNKAELTNILQTEKGFNWDVSHHRYVLTAVTMTACDLCAMFKPWDVQHRLVYVIMEEFWQQGDEERKRGITPVEMMDRTKKDELPNLEVGFIQSICVPCYELMFQVMPDTKPMLDGARANLLRWKGMAERLEAQRGGSQSEEPGASTSV